MTQKITKFLNLKKGLEPADLWHFCFKKRFNWSIIKILADYFSVDWLNRCSSKWHIHSFITTEPTTSGEDCGMRRKAPEQEDIEGDCFVKRWTRRTVKCQQAAPGGQRGRPRRRRRNPECVCVCVGVCGQCDAAEAHPHHRPLCVSAAVGGGFYFGFPSESVSLCSQSPDRPPTRFPSRLLTRKSVSMATLLKKIPFPWRCLQTDRFCCLLAHLLFSMEGNSSSFQSLC